MREIVRKRGRVEMEERRRDADLNQLSPEEDDSEKE